MPEFIAALRQLRRPIVLLAVAILVVQTLVAGLTTAHAAARLAAGGNEAGVICHGNGDEGTTPSGQAAHDCCTFCTTAGPAALPPASAAALAQFRILRHRALPAPFGEPERPRRAIRAGPSQAPPIVS